MSSKLCTPTDSHVDLAIAALRAGKHVLVEKPVAVDPADVERLAMVARENGTICMPAHCIRFWPAWAWLRDAIGDRHRETEVMKPLLLTGAVRLGEQEMGAVQGRLREIDEGIDRILANAPEMEDRFIVIPNVL